MRPGGQAQRERKERAAARAIARLERVEKTTPIDVASGLTPQTPALVKAQAALAEAAKVTP